MKDNEMSKAVRCAKFITSRRRGWAAVTEVSLYVVTLKCNGVDVMHASV